MKSIIINIWRLQIADDCLSKGIAADNKISGTIQQIYESAIFLHPIFAIVLCIIIIHFLNDAHE